MISFKEFLEWKYNKRFHSSEISSGRFDLDWFDYQLGLWKSQYRSADQKRRKGLL